MGLNFGLVIVIANLLLTIIPCFSYQSMEIHTQEIELNWLSPGHLNKHFFFFLLQVVIGNNISYLLLLFFNLNGK